MPPKALGRSKPKVNFQSCRVSTLNWLYGRQLRAGVQEITDLFDADGDNPHLFGPG